MIRSEIPFSLESLRSIGSLLISDINTFRNAEIGSISIRAPTMASGPENLC